MMGLSACSAGAPVAESPPAARSPQQPPAAEPLLTNELTFDEKIVSEGLKRHVSRLAVQIGERNGTKSWELAESSDYVAGELEALGYPVERQGYELGSVAAQNLSVTVAGGARGDELFVVGAHYDSPASAPGFESALSVGAVLELARIMRAARVERTLRFVFFALGELPDIVGEARGARQFARKMAHDARGAAASGLPEAVQKASEIENFGVMTLASLAALGNAVGPGARLLVPVSANQSAWKLESILAQAFHDDVTELSSVPLADRESDAQAFNEQGIPCLEIGQLGSSGLGTQQLSSLSDQQFNEAAQVVMRIRQALGDLVIERGTNDGTVTPRGS